MLFSASRTLLFVSGWLATISFASPFPSGEAAPSLPAEQPPSGPDFSLTFNFTESDIADRGLISKPKTALEYFTETYPIQLRTKYPAYNIVVLSTAIKFTANWEGPHGQFDVNVHVKQGTYKYVVVWGQRGDFHILSPVTAETWGFTGVLRAGSKDDSVIYFDKP